MGVDDRVSEAIDKMGASDPEGALFSICAAIDVTAKREYGKSGRSSYKRFIQENMGIITHVAFDGRRIENINLMYDHPEIKKNADGLCGIQDLIYHAVRCGLYHEAEIPDNLTFTNENMFRVESGSLVLPSSLVNGLVIAVIVSPANKKIVNSRPASLNLSGLPIPIKHLWGHRQELLWLLDLVADVKKMQVESGEKS